jgi:NADPH2:quinone reductase
MRGWQVSAIGEPEAALEWGDDLSEPVPGEGQVVVRVMGAACNFPDILLCRGTYQDKPALPFTPGLEVAGEVVAAGPGAAAEVGDRVIGTPPVGRGGFAELTVLDAVATLPWPAGMSAAQAAAVFVAYQTAICALQLRGHVEEGETVLVHAAAGGVGSAAVQLARAFGARVIATAGGAAKCQVARELGADEVIDYTSQDVVAEVKTLTSGRGV